MLFFLHFRREMIKVVCTIISVAIKDLELHLSNSNLPIGKNVVYFEPLAQKGENGKQMAGIL